MGIAIEHGSGWIKRIATFVKGIGQSMANWAAKIASKFGPSVPAIEAAHATGNAGFLAAVKTAAKEIATFLVNILKLGWQSRDFIKSIRYCFKCMFARKWYEKAYYLLQLISSVILMIGTAGSSLILKVALAVAQLCILIWDSILLAQLLSKKVIARLRECFTDNGQLAGAAS